MTKAILDVVLVFDLFDKFGDVLLVADAVEHLQHLLIGAAMRRPPQRGDARGDTGERVGAARSGVAHRCGRRILFVIGMQDEDTIERSRDDRVDFVFFARHGECHMEEIFGVTQ